MTFIRPYGKKWFNCDECLGRGLRSSGTTPRQLVVIEKGVAKKRIYHIRTSEIWRISSYKYW